MNFLIFGLALVMQAASGQGVLSAPTTTVQAVDLHLKCDDVCVEMLTKAEIDALNAAYENLATVQAKIRQAHGETVGRKPCRPYDSVTIERDKFVVIEFRQNSCIAH